MMSSDKGYSLRNSAQGANAYTVQGAPAPPPSPPSPPPPAPNPANWSQLWLQYRPLPPATATAVTISQVAGCGGASNGTATGKVLENACAEAVRGLSGMLNRTIPRSAMPTIAHALVLLQQQGAPDGPHKTRASRGPRRPEEDAFSITMVSSYGNFSGPCTVVTSPSQPGLLYGVFRLLHFIRTGVELDSVLPFKDAPEISMRTWDMWDNQDGSIERGYAGRSVFQWDRLPALLPRYTDYARFLASVGLNSVVLNNVNACGGGNEKMLATQQIKDRVPLSALLASWGIQTLVSVCFASPILVGNLTTADPEDPTVLTWWANKAREYRAATPSFVGILVKADSEGQPGPSKYGRTEVQGANMLGKALQPIGAVCIWRAFVHPPSDDPGHQPSYQYNLFHPWNGAFLDNIVLQVKNGPGDFQVREPVDALFGQMAATNLGLELQATQECDLATAHGSPPCSSAPFPVGKRGGASFC